MKELLAKHNKDLMVQLSTIKQYYCCIIREIDRLQKRNLSLVDSFAILNEVTDNLKKSPDVEIRLKLAQVLSKNPDLKYLKAFANGDSYLVISNL